MTRTTIALAFALLMADGLAAFAAPRYRNDPPPPVHSYGSYPSASRLYYDRRALPPNDTRRSLEYQLDMGAGSGRYGVD